MLPPRKPIISFTNENLSIKKHIYINEKTQSTEAYCPYCNNIIIPEFQENMQEKNLKQRAIFNNYRQSVKCPLCNHIFNHNEIEYINPANSFNKEFAGFSVFDNDNKLKLSLLFKTFGIFNHTLIFDYYRQYIIINIDTGMSYLMRPFNCKTKKTPRALTSAKIKNITYTKNTGFFNLVPDKCFEPVKELLYNRVNNKFYYEIPTINEYKKQYIESTEKLSYVSDLEAIINYNRIPNLNSYYINEIAEKYKDKKKRNRLLTSIKNTNSNPLKELFNLYEIEYTKSYRKLCSTNYRRLIQIKMLSEMFSIDNIIKIIESKKLTPFIDYNYEYKEITNSMRRNIEMIKSLNKKYKEKEIVNKIIKCESNCNLGYIEDTINMINRCKKALPEVKVNFTGTFDDIHNRYMLLSEKIVTMNIKLRYIDEELEIEDKFDEMEFKLAKDTYELKAIGIDMHICVGSYDKRAVQKDCYIVTLSKKNKYLTCIEINSDLKRIVQTKTYCNHYPVGKIKEVILKWAVKHKLDTRNCFDLNQKDEGSGCEIRPVAHINTHEEENNNILINEFGNIF